MRGSGRFVFAPSYKPRDPLRSPPRMNETGFRADPPTIVLQINAITDCTSGLKDESRTYVTETPACIHITPDPDYISVTHVKIFSETVFMINSTVWVFTAWMFIPGVEGGNYFQNGS